MPSDELTLSLSAQCTECSMAEAAHPRTVATFVEKHCDHTGHDIAWTEVDLPGDYQPGRCYEVRCFSCMTRHREPTRPAAEAWAAEHAEYSDHSPDKVEQANLDPLSEEAVNRLISVLSEPFGGAVPRSLVASVLADCSDVDESDAQDVLEEMLLVGACYEPSDGRIAAV